MPLSRTDVLAVETVGPPEAPPLAMAHGFTQTRRSWGRFGVLLGRCHRLVLVDLPGHGDSSDQPADVPTSAERLVRTVADSLANATESAQGAAPDPWEGPFDLLGYSFGARIALQAAVAHPQRVRRLILIGATAGIEGEGARADRRARDEALADDLESSGDVGGFVTRWLASPMFANLPPEGANLVERLRNTPAGLASSLRMAGTGAQEPLWNRLGEIRLPVLLLAGADDARFAAQAQRMARELPVATFALVPAAGHAAHLHRPDLTARIVLSWLGSARAD